MSRPRDLGEIRLQLHGEQRRSLVTVQNIGARKPISEQPVHLHFIDINGFVRESLHDAFKFRAGEEPPAARIVAFRQFSVESSGDDQLLVRIRRGVIEAAIFAQRMSMDMPQHLQLISFFMATLMKKALCECGCNEGSLRTRHSQSIKERVNQLLHGIIINNGAYLEWDTTVDGSIAAKFKKFSEKKDEAPCDSEIDEDNPLDGKDFNSMRRFSRRFQFEPESERSALQQSIPMIQWNTAENGTLRELSDEPNTEIYQRKIEEEIERQLQQEAA